MKPSMCKHVGKVEEQKNLQKCCSERSVCQCRDSGFPTTVLQCSGRNWSHLGIIYSWHREKNTFFLVPRCVNTLKDTSTPTAAASLPPSASPCRPCDLAAPAMITLSGSHLWCETHFHTPHSWGLEQKHRPETGRSAFGWLCCRKLSRLLKPTN